MNWRAVSAIGVDIWLATFLILTETGHAGSFSWWVSLFEFGVNAIMCFIAEDKKE